LLSELGFRRGQFASGDATGEALPVVAAVAERFVGRMAAAAQGNDGAPTQSVGGARRIANLDLPLHPEGTVIQRSNFQGH